jgi:hypothetical protein
VDVVEQHHRRPGSSQVFEERAYGPVRPEALGLHGRLPVPAQSSQGWEGGAELGQELRAQAGGELGRKRRQVGVEGVREHAEGHIVLEVGGPAGCHGVPALVGHSRNFGQEPGLAYARLPDDLQHAA